MTDPMPQDQRPRDQEARDRIGGSLDENLFIEAGAGTGKTTALVGRMVALVVDEGVAVEGIAAITFTERAAAELGDRFRFGRDQPPFGHGTCSEVKSVVGRSMQRKCPSRLSGASFPQATHFRQHK